MTSCATNHQNILKLHNMEEKISSLEKENDQFINREEQLRCANNELREELDTLKNTSRL